MRGAGQSSEAPGQSAHALHVQRFAVRYEYPVYFTESLFVRDNPVLRRVLARAAPRGGTRIFAVLDGGLADARPALATELCAALDWLAPHVALAAEPAVVPGGERAKRDARGVEALQQRFFALGLDRHACVLVIGGGAVQDMAGYAAATAHRGLRVVRVPSTVLAQCDGGVGVKNGINAFGAKNALGTFAPPYAVLNDAALLDTLPARERVAGMAEAVKVALIRDARFFGWLERRAAALARAERGALAELVRRAAELHLAHIARSGDPFEQGSARPLDYGHWAAHKLETLSDHALRHGEAVAIGMALDARCAAAAGLLDAHVLERLCALLEQLGFRLWHAALEQTDAAGQPAVLAGLEEFRAHMGGELTLILLADIGKPVEVHALEAERVREALDWLARRDRERRP